MRTFSIFILLIYWSIIIFAPVISEDLKISRATTTQFKIIDEKSRL